MAANDYSLNHADFLCTGAGLRVKISLLKGNIVVKGRILAIPTVWECSRKSPSSFYWMESVLTLTFKYIFILSVFGLTILYQSPFFCLNPY